MAPCRATRPRGPDVYPREVSLPIASLIGKDGHRFCTGWILKPGEGEKDKK